MRIDQAISGYLGINTASVMDIVNHAPILYRRYYVPKKRGGHREIYHPAKETKAVQSAAIDLLYNDELVIECVKGYIRGLRSPLLQNAAKHAEHLFLLKLDFSNFFPSIKPDDFRIVCGDKLKLHNMPLEKDEIDFLCKLFFVNNLRLGWFLGIGAPSSPFISNWVMYNLDHEIATICSDSGCTYTRYADDLCFSANSKEQLLDAEKKIIQVVSKCNHPKLEFNAAKRRLASKWSRRRVTGLSITPLQEIKVPRKTKRYIRSLLNKYRLKVISTKEAASLSGYLSFLNDCEPTYFHNLVMKYGADTVYRALKRN
jgi:hypothetical protein